MTSISSKTKFPIPLLILAFSMSTRLESIPIISIATLLGSRFTQSEYVLLYFCTSTVLALSIYFEAKEIISSKIGIIYALLCLAYIILHFIILNEAAEAIICTLIGTVVGFMSYAIIGMDLNELKERMNILNRSNPSKWVITRSHGKVRMFFIR